MESKPCHTFLMEHTFHFIDPYRYGTILMLLNSTVYRHISRRAVMLGPVEFNATGNPRSGKPYKSRLDDMIVINKMTLSNLVVCHLYPTTKFGKYHYLDIFILYEDGIPFMICLFIGD